MLSRCTNSGDGTSQWTLSQAVAGWQIAQKCRDQRTLLSCTGLEQALRATDLKRKDAGGIE